MARRSLNIGYVLNRFPKLSETFILNEVLELERHGMPLKIFSLRRPLEEPRHGALKDVRTSVTYLPEDGLPEWSVEEEPFAERAHKGRPFRGLFQGERLPKALSLPNILGKLAKQVRTIDDLSIFAAQAKDVPRAAALASLAKMGGVGHLHAHFGLQPTTVAMLASRLSGLPFSFSAHAHDIYDENLVDRALLREKIRCAEFVITCTEYNRRVLATLGGEKAAGKIIKIYHGADLTCFQPDPSVPREPALVLAVGRLVEKKGFRYLVGACRSLRDKGRSFRCIIAGEGGERDRLTQQISDLGVQDRVTLVGAQPQEQVLEMMKRATIFVLPCVVSAAGDKDGLPNVLIEAMAVGLPVISTTLSGIPEVIEHGKTGLLVPSGDSVLLAEAIEKLLVNPDLRERLARAGLKKVRESFDVRKNVKTLRDRFARSLINSARSRA